MAAKAKLLMRELKTVKSDLTFAKDRCSQLEEENKFLRERRDSGVHPEDDDLIRLQLETLLAEKAQLAHENSLQARENRFLREIVEYHQLTLQDVVYLDDGIEEVSEVYSISGHNSYCALGNQNPWLVSAPNHSSCSSLPVPVPPLSASKTSSLPVPEYAHHK